ncbi:dethiobiotin synthase [Mucilaginibacter polytrichastri]|uniref:ATP-dependent dethiobiotin synthetase BioD n=1 Tax=Mucilaginibacter polytrichastri TaxID=1302689 RepID=A0A1Q5ZXJ4_9SPHI|nr:dethiobiotin synthase [Mucilaginibacter polytrichastri]OKS86471.1 ATP-dependent dethiobiotin synthetase BioD [Mucilaginibacter polytrichastri]SFS78563.1 dethiobiotin synthetase [Mucilaginibacter polytrichastri]
MPQHKPLFITGIGTGIGKTITAAILTEKLKADYWKPIQSGDLDDSDTLKVKALVSNEKTVFHPETYRLTEPYSPHKSAAIDGIVIDIDHFYIPQISNTLIIEGAGGLMVPLNEKYLMIDLIKKLQAEVILVSQNYLGSINHTILSWKALQQENIPIKGIIFNGDADAESERYILQYTGLKLLGKIPQLQHIDKQAIVNAGKLIEGL